jgi:methyltransferase family protein
VLRFSPRYAPALHALAEVLRREWFEVLVAELLGPEPLRLTSLTSAEEVALSDAIHERASHVRALLHLVALEEPVRPAELESHLDAKALSGLVDLGLLVEEDGRLRTDCYRLVPMDGFFLVASPLLFRSDPGGHATRRVPSAYLGSDSAELCRSLRAWRPGRPDAVALDLCTGTGVVALAIAREHGAAVCATEVDPEALETARTNVALNGLEGRVQVVESDLYAGLDGQRFDLIAVNPPYVACPAQLGYPRWGWGGEDGLDLVRPILGGAGRHLRPGGTLQMVLNAYGGEREPLLAGWLDAEYGPRRAESDSVLLLLRQRRLDDRAFRSLASAALTGDQVVTDAEVSSAAQGFREHYAARALSHEYAALLRVRPSEPGIRLVRLFSTLRPRSVLALAPGYGLGLGPGGLWWLRTPDGEDLTSVPAADVRLLQALDGMRPLEEVPRPVERGRAWPLDRCLEAARLYLRVGAVVERDA